ncbi:MAG TPA: heavy metal-associated domain-containing protein [Bacteroidales bacterium]|nr:heavy metal-associated domain-containing protein [Bacteroidales bacterium]
MKTKKLIIASLMLMALMMVSTMTFSQKISKNEKEIQITTSAVCGMCKTHLEEGLAFEKGIKNVSLDLETKVLTVVYNAQKTDEARVLTLVNNLGYDANDTKANPEAYEKLPACCKKHTSGAKCTHQH